MLGKTGSARSGRGRLAALFMVTTALGVSTPATVGWAQADDRGSGQARTAGGTESRRFDIPAQPLGDALIAFGRQAGFEVSTDMSLVRGLQGSAVAGEMSWRQALDRLLAGTGLSYRLNGSMLSLVAAPLGGGADGGADGAAGAVQLNPIQVAGQGGQPYPPVDGFVATESAVATKTATPLLETPQAISVVTRDEIAIRNAQTDAQALLYVPGVWAQPFGGTSNPANPFYYIRGFSSSFGGAYVDGVVSPVNYRYEPFGMERLDIFRGPTSALYGRSDPGGMINRTTKRPSETALGELQVQGGTFDRRQVAADLSGPVDAEGRLLYRLTGLYRDADAPVSYDFGQREPDDRTYLAPAFTLHLTEDTSLTVLTSYLSEDLDAVSVLRDQNGDLTHVSLDQPGYGTYSADQFQIGYAFEHRFSDSLTLRQNARWSSLDIDNLGLYQRAINTATTTVTRSVAGFSEERSDIAVDTHAEGQFATGPLSHTLLGGLDYQHLQDDYGFSWGLAPSLNYANPNYDQTIIAPAEYLREKSTTRNIGLYLQDQAVFDRRWIATLGLRYDWARTKAVDELSGGITELDDRKFTYRAGLNYVFDNGISPYLSYATSFFPNGGVSASGTPFKPTTGQQYEAGVKYQPAGFDGFFSAAVYQLTRQNVPTPDPANPFFSVQTGEVRSRGVELEGSVDLATGLRATVAYSYNDAEITKANPNAAGVSTEGNRPNLTPAHLASTWVDYSFPVGFLRGWLIGGGVRYVASSYADAQNTIKNDAYTLVDAVIRYDFGQLDDRLAGASLAINAENLFNTEYTTCFSAFDCNWGAERTVMATLRYAW